MQTLPRRTNATNLSDDELLLFDFLFDQSLSFHHLRIEDYSFHMNCLYSHSLTDADLELTLASLVARGFLNCRVGKIWRMETRNYVDGKIYTMTDSGGHLWELARRPDWDRYVATCRWMLGIDNR